LPGSPQDDPGTNEIFNFPVPSFAQVVHHYPKYRIILQDFTCMLDEGRHTPVQQPADHFARVPISGLSDFPYPAGHREPITGLCRKNI